MPISTAIDKGMGAQTIANALGARVAQGMNPQALPMDDGSTPEGLLKMLASGKIGAEQLIALLTMISGLGPGGLQQGGGPPAPGGAEIAGPIGQAMG